VDLDPGERLRSYLLCFFVRPFFSVLSYGFAWDVEKTDGARGWTKNDRRNAGEVEYGTP
jgi:hypothetical protein